MRCIIDNSFRTVCSNVGLRYYFVDGLASHHNCLIGWVCTRNNLQLRWCIVYYLCNFFACRTGYINYEQVRDFDSCIHAIYLHNFVSLSNCQLDIDVINWYCFGRDHNWLFDALTLRLHLRDCPIIHYRHTGCIWQIQLNIWVSCINRIFGQCGLATCDRSTLNRARLDAVYRFPICRAKCAGRSCYRPIACFSFDNQHRAFYSFWAVTKGNCGVCACSERSEIYIALFARPLACIIVWVLTTKRKEPFPGTEIYSNKTVTSSRPVRVIHMNDCGVVIWEVNCIRKNCMTTFFRIQTHRVFGFTQIRQCYVCANTKKGWTFYIWPSKWITESTQNVFQWLLLPTVCLFLNFW